MKKLSLIIVAVIIMGTAAMTGCDGSSSGISSETTKVTTKATTEAVTKSNSKERLITESEAVDIAKEHIEGKLSRGDVLISTGSNQSAKTFDLVNYGDTSCEYKSYSGDYTINCKATCWGYDSYGEVVDKYEFDAKVYVDGESGFASSPYFILSKT